MSGYSQIVNGELDDQMAVIGLLILSDIIIAAIGYMIGRRHGSALAGNIFMPDLKSHIDIQRDVDLPQGE